MYKLFLDGVSYRNENGNLCNYKLTTSRNSKLAAETYQRNATITTMKNKVVSKAIILPNGKAMRVTFDPDEYMWVETKEIEDLPFC